MKTKKNTIRLISGLLSVIGFLAPFVADALDGGLMEEEINEKVEEKVNSILRKKGLINDEKA